MSSGSPSCTCARRIRWRRQRRWGASSSSSRAAASVAVGETRVRFLPGGPEGRPELVGEVHRVTRATSQAGVSLAAADAVVDRAAARGGRVDADRPRSSAGSAGSRGSTRSTRSGCSRPRRTGSARSSCSRGAAGRLRDAGARPRRPLRQRRPDDRRRAALLPRLRRRAPARPRAGRGARRGRRGGLPRRPAARSSAARPPRCRASTARASSTSPARASGWSQRERLIDGSRVEAGRRRARPAVGGPARERLLARAAR